VGLKYNKDVAEEEEQQQQLNNDNGNNISNDDNTITDDDDDDIVDHLCFQQLGIDELTPKECEFKDYYNKLLPLEEVDTLYNSFVYEK
jgi:hypothetical protein